MTEFSSLLDWEISVKQLRTKHAPVAPADALTWEHKLGTAMKKLPYLQGIAAMAPGSYSLVQKVQIKARGGNLEAVMADIRTVLKGYVFGSPINLLVFDPVPEGLQVLIAIVDSDSGLFTGMLQVVLV